MNLFFENFLSNLSELLLRIEQSMDLTREKKRIIRLFELIRHLVQKPPKSVKILAKYLHTTERTIYRDIELSS
jgi:hypothetical protein